VCGYGGQVAQYRERKQRITAAVETSSRDEVCVGCNQLPCHERAHV